MVKEKDVVIGYFAVHSPQNVLCDGDACIIAGSQSALNKYIKFYRIVVLNFKNEKPDLVRYLMTCFVAVPMRSIKNLISCSIHWLINMDII
jgi:hypothetical protein